MISTALSFSVFSFRVSTYVRVSTVCTFAPDRLVSGGAMPLRRSVILGIINLNSIIIQPTPLKYLLLFGSFLNISRFFSLFRRFPVRTAPSPRKGAVVRKERKEVKKGSTNDRMYINPAGGLYSIAFVSFSLSARLPPRAEGAVERKEAKNERG